MRSLVLAVLLLQLAATPVPPRTEAMVYDTAGVIDDVAERALDQRQRELFAKTGVALVVITVPRLVDETIDQLAVRVGQAWGVGKQGEDRGLVVALSRDDRKIFVATGYGTEGYLPDGRVGALIDEHAIPYLRRDQLSEGLVRLATALTDASVREFGVELSGAAPVELQRSRGGIGRILLVVLAIVGFALLARRHPLLALMALSGFHRGHGGSGFGGGFGGGGFGGGGFGGGGAGRSF